MSRAALGAVLVLLSVAPGCRPSSKDLDEINKKLDQLTEQQDELGRKLAAAGGAARARERDAGFDDRATLSRLEEGIFEMSNAVTTMSDRIDSLESSVDAIGEVPSRPAARPTARPGRPDPALRYRATVGSSHAKGPKTALVTVVMWTDYQCPFCARVQPTLAELERKYGSDVRFVHKHNPLPMHNRAMPAALAAEAAGKQGKFWAMHDALFSSGPRSLSDERLVELAQDIGISVTRFKRDLASASLKARIKKEQEQGVTLGARGTPAFFINGRFLSGAQPLDAFSKLIDEELAAAKKMVAAGTRQSRVYNKLMAKARSKP